MAQTSTTDPSSLLQRCKFCNDFEPYENPKDRELKVGHFNSAQERTRILLKRRCPNCSMLVAESQRIEQFLGDGSEQFQFNSNTIQVQIYSNGTTLISFSWIGVSNWGDFVHTCATLRKVIEEPTGLDYQLPSISSQSDYNVMSRESLDLLRSHLRDCKSQMHSHSHCIGNQGEQILPTRLVRIGLDRDSINLYEPKPHERGVYVALSHCWGPEGSRPIKTTTNTLEQRKTSISWESLSAVYQDSIRVCQMLGVNYLWIDSLCIIQDNSDDWEVESSKMAEYYSQAIFTIAVESSPDGNVSFLRKKHQRWQPHTYSVKDQQGMEHYYLVQEHCNLQYKRAGSLGIYFKEGKRLLTHRAWAFQEHLLSRRLIRFTPSGIIWQCKSGIFHEQELLNGIIDSPSLIPDIHYHKPTTKPNKQQEPAFREWGVYLQAYSQRDLTYDSDRLPALSGVAARFQATIPGPYLAGIWADHLPYSLCWETEHGAATSYANSEDYMPSWSWASLPTTEVFYPYITEDNWQPLLESHQPRILETFCDMSDKAPLGRVRRGAFILIEAPLFKVTMSRSDGRFEGFDVKFSDRCQIPIYTLDFSADCILDISGDYAIRASNISSTKDVSSPLEARVQSVAWVVWLARMEDTNTFFGLVLGKDPQSTGFHRIGTISKRNISLTSFDTDGIWTVFKFI